MTVLVFPQMSERVALSCNILNQLNELKNELQPLAQRASMLYDLLRSLPVLQHEYQFTLPYFLKLFDEALGGELPDDYTVDSDNEAVSMHAYSYLAEVSWM